MSLSNSGKSLESAVLASQLNTLFVVKIPHGMRYTGGGEKVNIAGKDRWWARTVAVKSPCDFMGCIIATGQAIAFDAKASALKKGFRIDHDDHFPPHQRKFLTAIGMRGAVAGALVEATEIGEFLWLDAEYFTPAGGHPWPVMPWDAPQWIRLGPTTHAIQFRRLLEDRSSTPTSPTLPISSGNSPTMRSCSGTLPGIPSPAGCAGELFKL